jgi:hypothetical protein
MRKAAPLIAEDLGLQRNVTYTDEKGNFLKFFKALH